jgi:hypothetical protein
MLATCGVFRILRPFFKQPPTCKRNPLVAAISGAPWSPEQAGALLHAISLLRMSSWICGFR